MFGTIPNLRGVSRYTVVRHSDGTEARDDLAEVEVNGALPWRPVSPDTGALRGSKRRAPEA